MMNKHFDAPGIVKIPGGFYIKNLGVINPPTGIRLKVRDGRYYWLAVRRENKALGEPGLWYEERIENSDEAWFIYRNVVKKLHDHVEYLYRGRHYARVELSTKKIPTGKVGVIVTGPEGGNQTLIATWGKEVLFREPLYSAHKYRAQLNQAIAAREKREKEWLEEHIISLAQALEVIDKKVNEQRRAARADKKKRNSAQSVGATR